MIRPTTPEEVARVLMDFGVDHHSNPRTVSRSQSSHAPAILAMARDIARMRQLLDDQIVRQRITQLAEEQISSQYEVLAGRLLVMQAPENGGRGVSVVRTMAQYLERGMVKETRTIARTDWDKIRNYPELASWINENLFLDEPLR